MRIKAFALYLFLFFSLPAQAVTGVPVSREWQKAWWGGGGTYPMIITDYDIDGRIYMTSDVAGNFYSNNAGDDWQYMNNGVTSNVNANIAQSELNPDIMYSLGNKLMKSTNRGKSWSQVGNFTGTRSTVYKTIAIGRTNSDIVFVGLDNGRIMKTTNGGADGDPSWTVYATPFGTNIKPTFLYLDPTDSYLIVGGQTDNGLKRYRLSDDSVETLTLSGTNSSYNWDFGTYNDGTEHFCVTAGLKIACSSDNGDNWSYTEAASADSNYIISRLAVRHLSNTEVRYVVHLRRISTQYGTVYDYSSSDSGATWTEVTTNITLDANNPINVWASFGSIGNVFGITADPHNEDRFWIMTDLLVFRSDDGGLNWVEKTRGAQNTVISDLACAPNGRCFGAGMDIGLLYTDDNGDHWTAALPHNSNSDPQGFAIAGFYWAVETRGTLEEWNAGTGQVVVGFSQWSDFIPRVAINSTNGEGDWTIVTSGLPSTTLNSSGSKHAAAWGNGYPRALAKCPSNDDILALGIDGYSATENGGIFISTNGGASWSRTTQPPQWKTYNAIAFDPSDTSCNTFEFAEFFYNSPDLPKTWRTTDRGTTWASVETDIGVYDMAYDSNGKAYKVGLDTNPMIDSSADGITWANMKNLNTTSQIADGLLVDPSNNNRVFVGVNDGTITVSSSGNGSSDFTQSDGRGGGSVYMTPNANDGTSAIWYHITGNLPSPSGVTAFAVNFYQGEYWLLAATDGAGVWRLRLKDTAKTTISNLRFNN